MDQSTVAAVFPIRIRRRRTARTRNRRSQTACETKQQATERHAYDAAEPANDAQRTRGDVRETPVPWNGREGHAPRGVLQRTCSTRESETRTPS